MLLIAASMTAAPNKRAQLQDVLTSLLAPTRAEPGCREYRYYQDSEDPDKFLFFEKWLDQKAIDAHFASAHFKHAAEQLPELVVGAPDIRIYEVGREVPTA